VAKTIPDEPMGRIRRSSYIETQKEIEPNTKNAVGKGS
jgi:hypothetical protein